MQIVCAHYITPIKATLRCYGGRGRAYIHIYIYRFFFFLPTYNSAERVPTQDRVTWQAESECRRWTEKNIYIYPPVWMGPSKHFRVHSRVSLYYVLLLIARERIRDIKSVSRHTRVSVSLFLGKLRRCSILYRRHQVLPSTIEIINSIRIIIIIIKREEGEYARNRVRHKEYRRMCVPKSRG